MRRAMIMDNNGIPVTWPELMLADRDLLQEELKSIGDISVQIKSVQPPWLPSDEFSGPALTLADAAVVFGPSVCTAAFQTLIPLLPTAMRDFKNGITNINRVPAAQLLSFFNTARCCGETLPEIAAAAEHDWPELLVQHVRLMTDTERQTLAFFVLIADRIDLIPSIIGGGPLTKSFVPGSTFDFNVQGFVRYLATARRDNAVFADIEPAWLNFIERFPHKFAASTLEWSDLLCSARIVATFHPQQPTNIVAESLHTLVARYR